MADFAVILPTIAETPASTTLGTAAVQPLLMAKRAGPSLVTGAVLVESVVPHRYGFW